MGRSMGLSPTELGQLLDLAIAKAPDLRAAGVLHVQLDGLAFALAPQEQPVVEDDDDDKRPTEQDVMDPLDDPATFGGPVPGYRRQPHEEHRR